MIWYVSQKLLHVSSIWLGLESCEPLFDDLGALFFDFQTWEELLKGFERVLNLGRVLCLDCLLNFQAVIKLAASAASPKTKIQESRGALPFPSPASQAVACWLPWIPGFWSSGGCASSRLAHGLENPPGDAVLAAA